MLELKPFSPEVAAKVYELERGAERGQTIEDIEWLLALPQNVAYGIWQGEKLVGCLGLEHLGDATVRYHIAMKRKAVALPELRALLWTVGEALFLSGVRRIVTINEREQRAERRLAVYCGLERVDGRVHEITHERLKKCREEPDGMANRRGAGYESAL